MNEMTAPRPHRLPRALAVLAERRTWFDTLHQLASLPIGIAVFTWTVTMLSVGVGTAIIWIGVPLLAVTVLSGRWIGAFERGRAAALLGLRVDAPAPFRGGTGWTWIRRSLTDAPGWRGLLYSVLVFVWGTIGFSLTVAFWSTALYGVLYPVALWIESWFEPWSQTGFTVNGTYYFNDPWQIAVVMGAGVLLLLATPWIVRGLAEVDRALVRGLLSRTTLTERVEQLAERRDVLADSAAQERRSLERDIHDGLQPRLVSLAMDLGMAREQLAGGDPSAAQALLDAAHEQAKHAMTEVRDLARGIHPAILTDRGLEPALSSLVSRSGVPVDLFVDVPERPSETTESIAYYLVAEAVTNAAKYAEARRVDVAVRRQGDTLLVRVLDDGRGGADPSRGTGLRGLRERVEAVDGVWEMDSPLGRGTMIRVELPCGR